MKSLHLRPPPFTRRQVCRKQRLTYKGCSTPVARKTRLPTLAVHRRPSGRGLLSPRERPGLLFREVQRAPSCDPETTVEDPSVPRLDSRDLTVRSQSRSAVLVPFRTPSTSGREEGCSALLELSRDVGRGGGGGDRSTKYTKGTVAVSTSLISCYRDWHSLFVERRNPGKRSEAPTTLRVGRS